MTMYITSPFAMLDRASGKAKKDFDFPEIEEATAYRLVSPTGNLSVSA